MTKAKTAKTAADAKTDAKAAKPKKDAAKEKSTSVRKTAAPAKKPAKETAPQRPVSKDTDVIIKPEPVAAEAKPVAGFSNLGLGVKIATKKPALSVAPGVMILGRPAQAKQDQTPRPSDRRLSKKEMAEIKTFLQEKRERLLAGMRRELQIQKERAESKAADEVDKATDAYDEDLSFEIATANDQELQDIQVALEKIEKGTYGECEVCGCGISPSRLKILPSATTCVACRGQEELARRRDEGQQLFSMMEDGDGEGEVL
ncbi:MAG: TraR/DksA C4-type zinc finger protein [Planctomycetaceae bacterium]|nr:TraR/DksA C4-type zinc finger protein [Planctomycetaceae bacterium]